MPTISAFGIDWIIRDDTHEFGSYTSVGVTRYNQASPLAKDGTKILSTTQRIGITAPDGMSAAITTPGSLGFGTYEAELIMRPDAFDPNVNAAVWTHNDLHPTTLNVEADYEFCSWRDQNRHLDRLQLGVYVNGKRPIDPTDPAGKRLLYPTKLYGATSYLYHRVTITQLAHLLRISAMGWWELDQKWHTYAFAEWKVPTPEMGVYKIGIGPVAKDLKPVLPKSASLPARMVVAGFRFTPA